MDKRPPLSESDCGVLIEVINFWLKERAGIEGFRESRVIALKQEIEELIENYNNA
jgi:hypothetical protein